jgi:hypothetical protein
MGVTEEQNMKTYRLALAAIALFAASPATAQHIDQGRFHIAATIGHTEYDLAGVGSSNVYSARGGVRLNRILGVEGLLGYTSVAEDGGNTSLYLPEAQLQARWPLGRVSPFVGGGVGMIVADSFDDAIKTDSDVTFSSAAGVELGVGAGVMLIGEVRVRGVGTRFAGSTGDFNIAVGYRF